MPVLDEITRRVQQLPEPLQVEVLRFADGLLEEAEHGTSREEAHEWAGLSLQSAMRGLDGEGEPDYSEADLRERYP